jgi:hypothetical protein
MSDPVIINCPADVWTKIATNVTTGMIWVTNVKPRGYKFTYRDSGNPAPTDDTDAIIFPSTSTDETNPGMRISASAGIDVYIKPANEAGQVRVDL